MVRIHPYNEEEEVNRQLRHACPRIRRWKSRIDESGGDVSKMREQSMNRSPVFVAIQRGSKNIMIRTPTSTRLWRKWIQQGIKYGIDDTPVTPIHISAKTMSQIRRVSLVSKSTDSSPRRSVPVSPVKSPLNSPVKVSFIRDDEYINRSPHKQSPHKSVPKLTLTPVPLNQVLRRKARMVSKISAIGKGRWVSQDNTLLSVPGEEVFQYDSATASETEDEIDKITGQVIRKMKEPTPSSPTDTLKKIASSKRRESITSSPKRLPSARSSIRSSSRTDDMEYMDSQTIKRLKRKIKAVGQTSLMFSTDRHHRIEEEISTTPTTHSESEEEALQRTRDKSSTIRKIRAIGMTSAALSPKHKIAVKEEEEEESSIPEGTSKKTLDDIKGKIRAIGAIESALSPKRSETTRQIVDYAEYGTDDESDETTKKRSRVTTFMRKLKMIGRFSFISKSREIDIKRKKSIKAKMRFIGRFLRPKKDSETEAGVSKFGALLRKIKVVTKLSPRTRVDSNADEAKSKEEEKDDDKVSDKPKSVSSTKNLFQKLCPCLARKKEPELLEYQSGSRVVDY